MAKITVKLADGSTMDLPGPGTVPAVPPDLQRAGPAEVVQRFLGSLQAPLEAPERTDADWKEFLNQSIPERLMGALNPIPTLKNIAQPFINKQVPESLATLVNLGVNGGPESTALPLRRGLGNAAKATTAAAMDTITHPATGSILGGLGGGLIGNNVSHGLLGGGMGGLGGMYAGGRAAELLKRILQPLRDKLNPDVPMAPTPNQINPNIARQIQFGGGYTPDLQTGTNIPRGNFTPVQDTPQAPTPFKVNPKIAKLTKFGGSTSKDLQVGRNIPRKPATISAGDSPNVIAAKSAFNDAKKLWESTKEWIQYQPDATSPATVKTNKIYLDAQAKFNAAKQALDKAR